MTCNTRIYNYANLHSEDKQIVQAQLLMLESVEDTITNYTYAKETSTNTLETIEFSTANLERLAFYFKNLKMEVSGKWYTTTKF